jgi:hypothetical protein
MFEIAGGILLALFIVIFAAWLLVTVVLSVGETAEEIKNEKQAFAEWWNGKVWMPFVRWHNKR